MSPVFILVLFIIFVFKLSFILQLLLKVRVWLFNIVSRYISVLHYFC